MQIPDDEHDDGKFEAYLKRFHPIPPEPVPTLSLSHSRRRSPPLRIWLAATAAIFLLVGAVVFRSRNGRTIVTNTAGNAEVVARHALPEPLTTRSANAWLAKAPSFKAAVDDLAFDSQTSPLPQGKQSAVAVLSKEKIRL